MIDHDDQLNTINSTESSTILLNSTKISNRGNNNYNKISIIYFYNYIKNYYNYSSILVLQTKD